MSTPTSDLHADDLVVRMPQAEARADDLDQDQEWCEVELPDGTERVRFHDYDRLFSIPGLYERLFYTELQCDSPTVVRTLLETSLREAGLRPSTLRVLDLGAGNGMVGEELQAMGASALIGVDILPEAEMAAERDRPGVYDDYVVCDLTAPGADEIPALRDFRANLLTTVAALGFGDIPPRAFATAFGYVAEDGWVAMTIKDDFLTSDDDSGFSRLIKRMHAEGALELEVDHRYQHRLAVSGEPLHYHAYIARKRGEIQAEWLDEAELVSA
ncbi:methyltransferase domain-containing protein [Patulibacter sp. NPDC049589]|uniref:class I SAM-dependent DNA methyltransferase n=1 Tax=Patulibacter sp. NPDC049589 TaxID=3154731 RepID=UPI00342D632E